MTLVGEDSTQTLSNKSIKSLALADPDDVTKRITFDVANSNTLTNQVMEFLLQLI